MGRDVNKARCLVCLQMSMTFSGEMPVPTYRHGKGDRMLYRVERDAEPLLRQLLRVAQEISEDRKKEEVVAIQLNNLAALLSDQVAGQTVGFYY